MFKVLNTTLVLLLTSLNLSAQTADYAARKALYEALPGCDQAVAFDSQYMVASIPSTMQKSSVRVMDTQKQKPDFEIQVDGQVIDVKIQNEIVSILTLHSFQRWSLKDHKQIFSSKSHSYSGGHWRTFATGFILQGTRAIISHGTLGVSVLDLNSGKFEKFLKMPTVSSAEDITLLDENTAILAIDNDDEAAFRGLFLMDLRTLEFTKQIPIDNAFPSAVRVLAHDRLMLVFFNAIWKFDLNEVLTEKRPQPVRRAWKIPGLFITDIVGKVAFDEKYVYGCFQLYSEKTGQPVTRRALALDLASLQLN